MFNLGMIECRLENRLRLLAQTYEIDELQKLCKLTDHQFRSWTILYFLESFEEIQNTIMKDIPNALINNAIIVKFGTYLNYLYNNRSNLQVVCYFLRVITKIIRKKSETHELEFFPQFYNYHK